MRGRLSKWLGHIRIVTIGEKTDCARVGSGHSALDRSSAMMELQISTQSEQMLTFCSDAETMTSTSSSDLPQNEQFIIYLLQY